MEMHNNFKHGDVLHCYGKGPVARLISLFTRSKITHTAIVVELAGQILIAESQANGSNLKSLSEWRRKYNYSFVFSRNRDHMLPEYRNMITERVISKIGVTGYDFKSLLWFHPRYIISGKWKGKEDDKAAKRMYCSEFVAYVLNIEDWYKLSPTELHERLAYHPEFYTSGVKVK